MTTANFSYTITNGKPLVNVLALRFLFVLFLFCEKILLAVVRVSVSRLKAAIAVIICQ